MLMQLTSDQKKQVDRRLRDLFEFYWLKVKEIVAAAERYDKEQRMVITSAIELRAAFDHVARVHGALSGIEAVQWQDAALSLYDYCEKNLSKAHGHLYRAAYDAYDIIAFALTEKLEKCLEAVSSMTLHTVVPDAMERVVIPFQNALKLVTQAKVRKDVNGREAERMEFEQYEEAVNGLLDARDYIDPRLSELMRHERQQRRQDRRRTLITIAGWVVGAVATIGATIMTVF